MALIDENEKLLKTMREIEKQKNDYVFENKILIKELNELKNYDRKKSFSSINSSKNTSEININVKTTTKKQKK